MSGQSSGQAHGSPTLPSSDSSSSSNAARLSAGITENPALDGHLASATASGQQHDSFSLDNEVQDSLQDYNAQDELGRRRHKMRPFSGFLLQPKSAPDQRPSFSSGIPGGQAQDLKGKKRADDGEIVLPKRRVDHRRHHTNLTIGSSPLAREILNSTPPLLQDSYATVRREDTLSVPSKPSGEIVTDEGDRPISEGWSVAHGNEPGKGTSSALGHDTDPAQIVNLALNLSESRRRNLSSGNTVPTNFGNRRLPSLSQHNASIPYQILPSAGGNLRQYLEQQRSASRNISPRSSRFRHRDSSSAQSPRRVESSPQSTASAVYDPPLSEGTIFIPSDATLARAEKARKTLELFYEYRRLLNHLPAISQLSQDKSAGARSGGKPKFENAQGLGRTYNPLQYIRNRKIRVRERRMINADADGWKELDNVRDWVDRVATEHKVGTLSADGQHHLPVFNVAQKSSPSADVSVEPGSIISGERQTDKPRRPRLDWSFSPWDLLADAYWMQQDDNVRHIEDAKGGKIFSRKQDANETPSRTSQEIIPSPLRRSQSSTRQNSTPEKIPSLFGHSRHHSTERDRSPHPFQDHKTLVSNGANSRDRKSRWTRNPIRSRDSSSSNDSLNHGIRGDPRDSGYFIARDHPESAALEKQMREMVKKEAQNISLQQLARNDENKKSENLQSDLEARRVPLPIGNITPVEAQPTRDWQDLKDVRTAPKPSWHSMSGSQDGQKFQPKRHLLDESNHAAANPPSAHIHVPGIGTELLSSTSRPSTPKNVSKSVVILDQQMRINGSHDIAERDFEASLPGSKTVPGSGENRANLQDRIEMDMVVTPGDELLPGTPAEFPSTKLQNGDVMLRESPRSSNDQESRFRGFLKGRRIAQLVGNEVHKVGDKLRKKDNLNTLSRVSSVQSGYATDESDLGTDLSALDSSPEDQLSIIQSRTEEAREGQNGSKAATRPTYHHRRLPSFRSAFTKIDQSPSSSSALANADHITRQQLAQRARGRPTRFDRLAPPKINVDGLWPSSSSPPTILSHTGDFDVSRNTSRRGSDSRSENRVHDADKRLKEALNTLGTLGSNRPRASSVSSLETHNAHTKTQPSAQEQREQSVSDQSGHSLYGRVTKRDIARVEALLLSSGVKANEISRRGQEIDELPSEALQSLPEKFQHQVLRVPRSQGHMFAARILIEDIEVSAQRLQNAEEQFLNTSNDKLHGQLRVLEKRLTQELTPSVRGFADDADALSTELTTIHTLNFKQLNDSIEILLRRRRRRFRWIRRGGYVLLEWTLLGIMWWVWLIVVMVRIMRCTIGALIGSLRWLFWV